VVAQPSAREYRAVLDFIGVALDNEGPNPFPEPVLDELRRLIPSVTVSCRAWDGRGRPRGRWLSSDEPTRVLDVWQSYADVRSQDPLPSGVITTRKTSLPLGQALRFSDFIPLRKLRRLDLHERVCRPLGVDYVMKLFLHTRSGGCSFVFDGAHRDFSERDRAILNTLAPHLSRLHQRATAASVPIRQDTAVGALTHREQQVLQLAAGGLTNRQIADTLYIAPGTVRKHLDNIYAKLAVPNRTTAARRIFAAVPDGSYAGAGSPGHGADSPVPPAPYADVGARMHETCLPAASDRG
jgi:DNA-binding CsgD family transcriptional regulator